MTFANQKVVNIYLVHKIHMWSNSLGENFVLGNPFFEAVKLAKNSNFNKYKFKYLVLI